MKLPFNVLLCLTVGTFSNLFAQGTYDFQPTIEARSIDLINDSGFHFKDLNRNQRLDIYEDWRQPVDARIDDLIQQMTVEEKVGMMLINKLNAGQYGALTEEAVEFVELEKMTRFIFRNLVTNTPNREYRDPWRGPDITPFEAAQFMNAIQELAESTRLGIPIMFKSNARNHLDNNARAGINNSSGSFSTWPKEAGLAATRDMELIEQFAKTMKAEWTAIGLRGMYGYIADLSTEPRWYRIHETFTEDSDLAAEIITELVTNLQGRTLDRNGIALTVKHFPGGGPQENGADPHYSFGRNQIYPANNFDYHLRPFQAAITAGVSSFIAYYGIPLGQQYMPNDVGMAFSKGILTDLLRNQLGFRGYINSDTGIIGDKAWGLEDKEIDDQILITLDAGTDILSGFNDNDQLLRLVKSGRLAESKVNESVQRLLREQFQLGLFENPFVDPNRAAYVLGNASFQKKADIAQRKSIVLLQNDMKLPISIPDNNNFQLYTMNVDVEDLGTETWSKIDFIKGEYSESGSINSLPDVIPNYALIRISVTNDGAMEELRFGGANPDELDFLSFTQMSTAKSWKIVPPLPVIKEIMQKIGPEKTILSINFRQPYVIDQQSELLKSGAIFATFGVNDEALMDVIFGKFHPTGKLPFALANKPEAISRQQSDAPGYSKEDTLYPFGFGLTYDE